jgi:hypothetical protein
MSSRVEGLGLEAGRGVGHRQRLRVGGDRA